MMVRAAAGVSRRWLFGLVVVAALILAGLTLSGRHVGAQGQRPVLLFTTLSLLWAEGDTVSDLLRSDAAPHWALGVLGDAGPVQGIDALAGSDGQPAIGAAALLVMAQPRPLSPAENVALDDWVRGGGRVLLFADPMLTAHSSFALGDRRRPQDVVLLSPILTRWGLELTFDEAQRAGERRQGLMGGSIPVNLPGRFSALATGCTVADGGLLARCRIGRGTVTAIADAALLEPGDAADRAMRGAMLGRLIAESQR